MDVPREPRTTGSMDSNSTRKRIAIPFQRIFLYMLRNDWDYYGITLPFNQVT